MNFAIKFNSREEFDIIVKYAKLQGCEASPSNKYFNGEEHPKSGSVIANTEKYDGRMYYANESEWYPIAHKTALPFTEGMTKFFPEYNQPIEFFIKFNNENEKQQILTAAASKGLTPKPTNTILKDNKKGVLFHRKDKENILFANLSSQHPEDYQKAIPFNEGMKHYFNIDITPTETPIPITVPNGPFCIKFNNNQEKEELAKLFTEWLECGENKHYSGHWKADHNYITSNTAYPITDWWFAGSRYQSICFDFQEGKAILLQFISNKQPATTQIAVPIVEDSTPKGVYDSFEYPHTNCEINPNPLLKEEQMRKHFIYNYDHKCYDGVAPMDVTFERRVAKNIAKMIWWPTKHLGLIGIKTGRRAIEVGVAAGMLFGAFKLAQTEIGQQTIGWVMTTVQTVLQNPTIT